MLVIPISEQISDTWLFNTCVEFAAALVLSAPADSCQRCCHWGELCSVTLHGPVPANVRRRNTHGPESDCTCNLPPTAVAPQLVPPTVIASPSF